MSEDARDPQTGRSAPAQDPRPGALTHETPPASFAAAGRFSLAGQILLALGLAVLVGLLLGRDAFGVPWVAGYDFVGDLFLQALKMVIVPLVASSVIVGMAGIGGGQLGRLGGRVLGYYALTTLLAVLTALVVVNLWQPGHDANGRPLQETLTLPALSGDWGERVQAHDVGDFADIFSRMIPSNVVAAASSGDMLGLIVFCLLFGFFLSRIATDRGRIVLGFFEGMHDIMLRITELIMRAAPYGVFALVAEVVATTGLDVFLPMLGFMGAVMLGLAIHVFITLPLLLWLTAGVPPLAHFKAMAPAILTAFSTASSAATLPVTLDCVEKRAGVSRRTASFVLPLGATVNMDGTALYECAAVLFIAQAYGVALSLEMQALVVVLALMTSIGVAAIPSASLVAIGLILTSLGLPLEAMALLLVVDRVLDMLRTSANVFGDASGAVIVARWQGEAGILGLPAMGKGEGAQRRRENQ
ncbi:MAG: dicarboxylate/amino acid:cation symporter [Halothiobacillaceae bacterium]|nr:dicarboxylate/amino acid:cation symporter [Halothiobacillaceae bacterium]